MNRIPIFAFLIASLLHVGELGVLPKFPPDLMAEYVKIKAPFFACMKGKGFEMTDDSDGLPTPVKYPSGLDGWLKFSDSLTECFSNGKDDTQCCQKAGVTDENKCTKLCNGKPPVDLKAAGMGVSQLLNCIGDEKVAASIARCLVENYN